MKTSTILFIASSKNSVNGFSFNIPNNYPSSLRYGCSLFNMDQECPSDLFKCINGDCIQVYSSKIHYLFGSRRILSGGSTSASIPRHHFWIDDIPYIYEGAWDAINKRPADGEGRLFREADGILLYRGFFKDGLFDGPGISYYSQGIQKYNGMWSKGTYNGLGRYYDSIGYDGEPHLQYEGNWENGKMNGAGVFYFPNGNMYEGQFVDDAIEGQGELWVEINALRYKLFEGTWHNNEFKEGRQYDSRGNVEYEGNFKEFKPYTAAGKIGDFIKSAIFS